MSAAFEDTLTAGERHLARRLESFGDVVFGFTISQLVLQFPLPVTPSDLTAHGQNYVIYVLTFAIIALLWLSYHRMPASYYVPRAADIALTFAFLAFTGLAPYAMYAYLHFMGSLDGARYGLGAYLVCGLGTLSTSTSVRARGYRRGALFMTPDERLTAYRRLLMTGCVAAVFAVALAVDVTAGIIASTPFFILIAVASIVIRRTVRTAPAPA